jgi:hypothetical protein
MHAGLALAGLPQQMLPFHARPQFLGLLTKPISFMSQTFFQRFCLLDTRRRLMVMALSRFE